MHIRDLHTHDKSEALSTWPLSDVIGGIEPHIIRAYERTGGGAFGEQVAMNFVSGLFLAVKEDREAGKISLDEAEKSCARLGAIAERIKAARTEESVSAFIRRAPRKGHISAQAGPVTLCSYCSRPVDDVHSDHVVARALGGDDGEHNRVPTCPDCNLKKSDKPLLAWLAEIGGSDAS